MSKPLVTLNSSHLKFFGEYIFRRLFTRFKKHSLMSELSYVFYRLNSRKVERNNTFRCGPEKYYHEMSFQSLESKNKFESIAQGQEIIYNLQ